MDDIIGPLMLLLGAAHISVLRAAPSWPRLWLQLALGVAICGLGAADLSLQVSWRVAWVAWVACGLLFAYAGLKLILEDLLPSVAEFLSRQSGGR